MPIIPFFLGVVAMQLVYLMYNYILFKKKEFLFYVCFTSCFTLFFSFVTIEPLSAFGNKISNGNLFLSAMTFIMFGAAFYYKFVRHFTEMAIIAPKFDRVIRSTEYAMIFCASLMLSNTLLFSRKLDFIYPILRVVYFVNIFIQAVFILFLFRSGKLLNLIIAIGSIIMAVFIKVAILPIVVELNTKLAATNTFNYVFTGLIFNFLFFNFALIYKSRKTEKEKTALEIQKQTELFNQRNQIGNDLHDDIGASLSSLHVYSSIVENEMSQNPALAQKYLRKITFGIRTVMENMNDVIWAVNVQKKDGKLFSSRLKDFNMDLFDAKNIECTYQIDSVLESRITQMLVRKNILLIAKEAINNIVKHSHASKVSITLRSDKERLILEVEDNGRGMLPGRKSSGGNGMNSLQLRTAQLGGILLVKNKENGSGVLVRCSIPLANISD